MHLGPYAIVGKAVLAPMAGVTDRPFRQLCRRMGAAWAVSEMVSSNSLLWGSEKTLRRADHRGEPEPRVVQILGADPPLMARAARHNVDNGAQIIDINMGCPAKKVCHVQAGSALLRDEALVGRILEAVVGAVEVPVTLKIRTGWDKTSRNAATIARIAQESGIQALAIHGRTRACGYSGEAEFETIAAVREQLAIPLIANGDITTPQRARAVLEQTGADAVMIGRAAQGRPWIFREINHYLATGELLPEPSLEVVREILLDHLDNLYAFYGEHTGVRMARKHIAWYSKGQPHGAAFREAVVRVEGSGAQRAMVADFFERLIERRDDCRELAA